MASSETLLTLEEKKSRIKEEEKDSTNNAGNIGKQFSFTLTLCAMPIQQTKKDNIRP